MVVGNNFFAPLAPEGRTSGRRTILALVIAYGAMAGCGFAQQRPSKPGLTNLTVVAQANGAIIEMPKAPPTSPTPAPVSRYTGLRIAIDPRWTNTYGYRPIEVTVTSPLGAMKTDRTILLNLRAGWNRFVSVEQEFVLPAGATSATTTVSMPIYQTTQNYYSWDLWVDGVKDKDLCVDPQMALSTAVGTSQPSGNATMILVAGPNKEHRSLVATGTADVQVLTLELSMFPTRWIDYSAMDVVSLSVDEVNQLSTNNPAAFEALGQWVRAGGQLWICDVGKELDHLPEVSKLWQLPDAIVEDAASEEDTKTNKEGEKTDGKAVEKPEVKAAETGVKNGWRALRFRRPGDGQFTTLMDSRMGGRRPGRGPDAGSRTQNNPDFAKGDDSNGDSGRRRYADTSQWFVEQNLGLGKLRAYRDQNDAAMIPLLPYSSNPNGNASGTDNLEDLPRGMAVGLRRTQHWDTRHGMTPDSANTEFAKFLVPGVGMAPVTYFQVLITLFVLLIGPANYWVLKRFKRLHLMVLTVPLAAGITTLALFAYAILADGFETRVRADSFTTLDQRTGEAACWSRLSYYSGLAPGGGLKMPTDVTLYPILPAWAGDLSAWEERDIVWSDDQAQLKQGWLSSRTPTQYLTIRSRKTPHSIEMLESGDKLRIKNQLGTPIKTLIVVNSEGNFYLGENLSSEAAAGLKAITHDEAAKIINKIVVDNAPQAPAELALAESDVYALRSRARYQPYWRYGLQPGSGKLSENLARAEVSNLAGLSGQTALELPPRSYVAITETGPEVALGVSNAKEESSFHVIEGCW